MIDKHVIRTSDRGNFKKCRRAWNYESKIRHHFSPAVVNKNLEFGTAVHAGLEVWYDPENWHLPWEVRRDLAVAEFIQTNKAQCKAHGDNIGLELEEDYHERNSLGQGMLTYFGEWASRHDRDWTPVLVEHEFEVPVVVPHDSIIFDEEGHYSLPFILSAQGFDARLNTDYEYKPAVGNVFQLYYHDAPVVYQGRIDLAVEIDEEIWIVDHKTAASFKESWPELDVDTQVTSYAWAAQFYLDEPIAGVIYQQLKKSVPQEPPLVYKGTKLSKDKSQSTTSRLYIQAIEKHGFDYSEYKEFIDHLQAVEKNGDPFVRRLQLHRSPGELKSQEIQIFEEATDMLANPATYPNPGWSTCPSCPFKAPCLADNDAPGEQRGIEMLHDSPDFLQGVNR